MSEITLQTIRKNWGKRKTRNIHTQTGDMENPKEYRICRRKGKQKNKTINLITEFMFLPRSRLYPSNKLIIYIHKHRQYKVEHDIYLFKDIWKVFRVQNRLFLR